MADTRDKQEAFRPAPQASSPSKIRNANSHLLVPSLTSKFTTRLKKICNTNQYEVTSIPVTMPPPAPPPDAFPRFDAEASTVLQEFEDFLEGKVPSDYVKSLLRRYFKDNSRQQGEIGIFVEPLDDLYRMQTAYKDISAKALQADGPSKCQKKMECAGEKIGQLISWLEDIWMIDSDSSLVLLVDGVGITFGACINGQQANNIARAIIKGKSAKIRSDYPSIFEAASEMSRSPRVGITEEQRIFLEPYIAYYGRLKANAREHPKPYSVFQSQLWLLWKDRFRAQLQPPDPTDPDACKHWYACCQKDLAAIIRTLEMWQPFYAAGRKRELAQRVKVRAKVAKAARAAAQTHSDEQKDGVAGVRRSERTPKPWRLVDNAESEHP
ncbi:hypothetical protein ARMSODRAFT_974470 [Armillaria solidipes]|uniref:Uncharacterized protein n=1 Tax=Armillaria solidipes TaxID=1076256 RepID=A0A2H3BI63_9AGAR|nr:hypothetical protein ARMSODRAFT_974470 [Armillaria solidipes]